MRKLIKPSHLTGNITAPSSKSMMQRAVAIASLSDQLCEISGITPCDDLFAALRAAEALGASVEFSRGVVRITPQSHEASEIVDCGEAGLSVRMFAPIAAIYTKKFSFIGKGSLLTRPLNMIEDALLKMGVSCTTNNGFLPMEIKGPAQGGTFEIDGSVSSQLLTGLLIALPCINGVTNLTVNSLTSRPYIDMTIEILNDFGVIIKNDRYQKFFICGGQKPARSLYSVEGDWSGAAFLIVAAALAGEITISNLKLDSTQADREILDVVILAGAAVSCKDEQVRITHDTLQAFSFDATECPDLFPPLVALAAGCKGLSTIKGASRLRYKESDRAKVLIEEFSKIGVKIHEQDDMLKIEGGAVEGGVAHSNNDHRIAMALAVAGLISKNGVAIQEPGAIDKSYPGFYKDIALLGADIDE